MQRGDRKRNDEFDGDMPPLSPRSILFRIGTRGVGAQREGLLSYLVRLARAHSVSARRLIREVFVDADPSFAKLGYASFFTKDAVSVNGLGEYAESFSGMVSGLTGGAPAYGLTLLGFKGLFPPNGAGLLARYPKWCRACFGEMVRRSEDVFRPLSWSLALYGVCTSHKGLLEDRCRRCGRRQPFIPNYPDLGHCAYCGSSLADALTGEHAEHRGRQPTELEAWSAEAVSDLVANMEDYSHSATASRFAEFVRLEIDRHSGGNRAAFCRDLGLHRWAITKWLSGDHRPTMPQLITVCYGLGVLPGRIFGVGLPIELGAHQGSLRKPPGKVFRRAARPLLTEKDRQEFRSALSGIAANSDDVRPLSDVARQLGLSRSCCSYWFPEQSATIKAKHAAFRKRQARERAHKHQEAVDRVVQEMVERGEYPARKRVDAALRTQGAALIRPELRKTYRSAIDRRVKHVSK